MKQCTKLWVQMACFTFGILVLSLGGGLFFIRKITGPLTELAQVANQADHGELGVRVNIQGHDEVATLAASFNHMLNSLQTHTRRLEEQTVELERAHRQTRTFCDIVQEIGALHSLQEIGVFLIRQFQSIVRCHDMVFLIRTDARDRFFIISQEQSTELGEPDLVREIAETLDGLESREKPTFIGNVVLPGDLIPLEFQTANRQAVIPISLGRQLFGALIMSCAEKNDCSKEEIELVGLMLNQAAAVIKRAVLHEEEVRELQMRLESSSEFCGIISKDPKMQIIFQLIEDIAPTDATVLIQGESGTGKELVARAVHEQSPRRDKPFVVIDCSAYPATLLESELFGHEKGAFTGAVRQKSGRFEQANGGTVFLDEIGDVPLSAQIKLLRVLQTQRFERLGGEKSLNVDVRIIAATNKDLLEEVKRGQFREDLYYRLNVIPLHLPPLVKRHNDVPLLAQHFLRRFALTHRKNIDSFSPESMRLLLDHTWPGNVRELENTIEHAVVLSKGPRIESSHLPVALYAATPSPAPADRSSTIMQHERKLLQETMETCGWNKKAAAQRLGISRSTLYEKLRKYEIKPPAKH